MTIKLESTMVKLVELVKRQNAKIESLTADVEKLKKELQLVPKIDPKQLVLDRYELSKARNRHINETPEVIAFVSHLLRVKNVPAMRIYESGLITQSRMHGLAHWETQHLLDFCSLHNVTAVYENGVTEERAKELVPNWETLKTFIKV